MGSTLQTQNPPDPRFPARVAFNGPPPAFERAPPTARICRNRFSASSRGGRLLPGRSPFRWRWRSRARRRRRRGLQRDAVQARFAVGQESAVRLVVIIGHVLQVEDVLARLRRGRAGGVVSPVARQACVKRELRSPLSEIAKGETTRSPLVKVVTSAPTASTTPRVGRRGGTAPSRSRREASQRPCSSDPPRTRARQRRSDDRAAAHPRKLRKH